MIEQKERGSRWSERADGVGEQAELCKMRSEGADEVNIGVT